MCALVQRERCVLCMAHIMHQPPGGNSADPAALEDVLSSSTCSAS